MIKSIHVFAVITKNMKEQDFEIPSRGISIGCCSKQNVDGKVAQ